LYLTDFWRNPIPPASASGTVTVGPASSAPAAAAARRTLSLGASGDALVAATPLPVGDDQVEARFELTVNGRPIEMDFTLPVGTRAGGAPGTPAAECAPPEEQAAPDRRLPRCVLRLERPVSTLAVTPDRQRLLVAAVDLGVSVWRLPEGRLELGFAPPPPTSV